MSSCDGRGAASAAVPRLAARGMRLASFRRMMDRTLGGTRCRTVRPIAHHGGYLPRRLEGTIRYAIENIGRTLLRVDFDSGVSVMVLPDDVAVDGRQGTPRG
jgi:hypothetical protein